MMARTSMPALSVAIAEFQSRRAAGPGRLFAPILPRQESRYHAENQRRRKQPNEERRTLSVAKL